MGHSVGRLRFGYALRAMIGMVMVLMVATGSSHASVLTPVDYDTLGSSGSLAGERVGSFAYGALSYGSLDSKVYFDEGTDTYTYVLAVIPTAKGLEFNTGFPVHGFDPAFHMAGYSYGDVSAAGAPFPEQAFHIEWEDDYTIDWNTSLGLWWQGGERISFFFQSALGPEEGDYNMAVVGGVGEAGGLAPTPVPIPSAGLLLLSGAPCLLGFLRKPGGVSTRPGDDVH
ncbi:MAG: hypothetical protein AB1512_06895 [Thermodesulfobacteriota bacterium]